MKKSKQFFDFYNLRDGYERENPKKYIKKELCSYCGDEKICGNKLTSKEGKVTFMCRDCEKN